MNNIKIEGHNAEKDSWSKAIISTDHEKLQAHRTMRNAKRMESDRISKLENDVIEIKNLLLKLIKTNDL